MSAVYDAIVVGARCAGSAPCLQGLPGPAFRADRSVRDVAAHFVALRFDQQQTNRFFGTIVGTVPIPEFFSPENIGRIMGAARPEETA